MTLTLNKKSPDLLPPPMPLKKAYKGFFLYRIFIKFSSYLYAPFNHQKRKLYRTQHLSHFKLKHQAQKYVPINQSQIPIFIISFNRLSYLKQMVTWLEKFGLTNIHIVDNASTYPPLIKYLEKSVYTIHRLNKNYGHMVVWKSKLFDDIINHQVYVVTDPDIAPNPNLPPDFLSRMYHILKEYCGITKVGFALQIDDLPKDAPFTQNIQAWEKQFWERPLRNQKDMYFANIDTTFALYRAGKGWFLKHTFYRGIRLAGDYTARHIPWYKKTYQSKEDLFYQEKDTGFSSIGRAFRQLKNNKPKYP